MKSIYLIFCLWIWQIAFKSPVGLKAVGIKALNYLKFLVSTKLIRYEMDLRH